MILLVHASIADLRYLEYVKREKAAKQEDGVWQARA